MLINILLHPFWSPFGPLLGPFSPPLSPFYIYIYIYIYLYIYIPIAFHLKSRAASNLELQPTRFLCYRARTGLCYRARTSLSGPAGYGEFQPAGLACYRAAKCLAGPAIIWLTWLVCYRAATTSHHPVEPCPPPADIACKGEPKSHQGLSRETATRHFTLGRRYRHARVEAVRRAPSRC